MGFKVPRGGRVGGGVGVSAGGVFSVLVSGGRVGGGLLCGEWRASR